MPIAYINSPQVKEKEQAMANLQASMNTSMSKLREELALMTAERNQVSSEVTGLTTELEMVIFGTPSREMGYNHTQIPSLQA